ncbi:MAG: crotonase/enoyl-CoA hydratase family protein [Wenzhouxiangella sp.]|nr:MAG: crotonase/enoyl-CoA hydratase family protein [Wenzhouxiangella sp.]
MTLINDRVLLDFHDSHAEVALARPDKYNGLDLAMIEGLVEAARRIGRQRQLRAVVVHGKGPAFCAGLDFASVTRRPGRILAAFLPWLKKDNRFQRMCLAWRDLPIPVIAVTHGYCFGGGMQLALGCDFRFSTPDCRFSIMEIEWGLIPDMGASVTLRDLVAVDVAMELTMTARQFDAREALSLQLLTRIEDDPLAAARTFAAGLAERSPDAVRAAKRLFRRTRHGSERRALRLERRLQLRLLLGRNQREAMRARLEKRRPTFRD